MSAFDVTDEIVLRAAPAAVFGALVDFCEGRATWWHPYLSSTPEGELSPRHVGGLSRLRTQGPVSLQFTARTTEVVEDALLRFAYVDGAFRGGSVMTFDAVEGGTRLRFRWQAEPHAWLVRVARHMVSVPAQHSRAVRGGFAGLEKLFAR